MIFQMKIIEFQEIIGPIILQLTELRQKLKMPVTFFW